MALPNPTLAPPTLLSTDRRNVHKRSSSHSPIRLDPRYRDPLLRDLSPTTTLRLFTSADGSLSAVSSSSQDDIEAVSDNERALGIKAAQACLDIRVWARELESWEWSSSFDQPKENTVGGSVGNYWGGLPSDIVEDREKRIRQITTDLECIDVEELKDFALSAHHEFSPNELSRRNGNAGNATVRPLADYTTLITATILQALPYLSRVVRSLNLWSVRLEICRKAPEYLRDLDHARRDLQKAWEDLADLGSAGVRSSMSQSDSVRDSVIYNKATMQKQIRALGTRLDHFLDDLEGRDETIPDHWIDEFERLEAGYADWAVQADRKLLEYEWFRLRYSMPAASIPKQMPESETDLSVPVTTTGTLEKSLDASINSLRASINSKSSPVDRSVSSSSTLPVIVSEASPVSSPSKKSAQANTSPRVPRHIPIILDYDGDGSGYPSKGVTGYGGVSQSAIPKPVESDKPQPQIGSIRVRSPFLNGQIENAESLQKQAASPVVRPFEHASTAFTRLFKRDKRPAELIRRESENSLQSNGSIRQDLENLTKRGRQQSLTPLDTRTPSGHSPHSVSSLSSAFEREASREPRDFPATRAFNKVRERAAKFSNRSEPSEPPSAASEQQKVPTPLSESPMLLSSPFPAPDESDELPENWPLRSPSPSRGTPAPVLEFNQESHVHPNAALHSPGKKGRHAEEKQQLQGRFREGEVGLDITRTQAYSTDSPTLNSPFASDQDVFQSPQRAQAKSPTFASRIPRHFSPIQRKSERAIFESYMPSKLEMPSQSSDEDVRSESPTEPRPEQIRRASYASIEIHPRSAVKAVEVSRRTSYSSRAPSEILDDVVADLFDEEQGDFATEEMFNFPSPPSSRSHKSAGSPTIGSSTPIHRRFDSNTLPSSPLLRQATPEQTRASASVPNLIISKQRRSVETNEPPRHVHVSQKSNTSKTTPEDSFDRHVSEVVQRLHGNIRFKPRPGAETPVFSRPSGFKNPLARSRGGRTGPGMGHSMTIAPAETSAKKSSTTAEPVKLYHLRQEGREEPIKLFVRLVGEDERVMVRVGGGWADLADYLRQYADHHGSRTVSGNALEVLPADTGDNNGVGAGGIRRVSGPAEFDRARTPVTPGGPSSRPESSDENKDWTMRIPPPLPHSDSPTSQTIGVDTPYGASTTPANSKTPTNTSGRATPKSMTNRSGVFNTSRPSTPDSITAAGLSGPRRSAGPSSDHKARWVEGMIERAKASAEQDKSKGERERFFGDIGRIGGTRRVIFRSASNSGGPGGSDSTSASSAAVAVAAAVAAAANTRSEPAK